MKLVVLLVLVCVLVSRLLLLRMVGIVCCWIGVGDV